MLGVRRVCPGIPCPRKEVRKIMTPSEEAAYYARLAFQLREQATDMLEEAQRLTKLSKETVRKELV